MSEESMETPEFVRLYRRAFTEHRSRALWNLHQFEAPTPEDALVVARALRMEGNMNARFLAEEIERACLAAV